MANLQLLAIELSDDPLARGYAGMTDAQVVTSINTADRSVPRTMMTASEVANAIDPTEFNALLPTDEQKIWNVLSLGELNPYGIEATIFTSVFGVGSDTITALAAARSTLISRADELSIGSVRIVHVASARRLQV